MDFMKLAARLSHLNPRWAAWLDKYVKNPSPKIEKKTTTTEPQPETVVGPKK